jgi:quercetin dioxygenase-like cupin family protein
MLSIKNQLISIHKRQRTIDAMLKLGILTKEDQHFENEAKTIDVDILYQKDATVGLGTCGSRGCMPEHSHPTKHYLVCVSGRFIVKFDGVVRVLSVGDCVSIPKGVPHTTQCIHEGKIIFINVPADGSWGEYG